MTTNFYVCLRREGPAKSPTGFTWHAGITDKGSPKKRCSKYVECVIWDQFQTRDEALAFEAAVSLLTPYIFLEELQAKGYGEFPTATGDDTPDTVDALSLVHAYTEMLTAWRKGELPVSAAVALRSTKSIAYRNQLSAPAFIERVRKARPSVFTEPVSKEQKEPMWS